MLRSYKLRRTRSILNQLNTKLTKIPNPPNLPRCRQFATGGNIYIYSKKNSFINLLFDNLFTPQFNFI